MALSSLTKASESAEWDHKWKEIFDHYQRDLRHAHYIRALAKPAEKTFFELGAGSFRDMAALRRMGIDCDGMDFSAESVARAKAQFPEFSAHIFQMSGFEMPLGDGVYDLTYHNGFWVLFSDDDIQILAREQRRVSRSRMIATVHNAHNTQFVDYFARMKTKDPLYDVRFFTLGQIEEHMRRVSSDVVTIPVGKGKRRHEDLLIRMGLTNPRLLGAYLKLSGHHLLATSERLLCIGTVS